MPDSIHDYLQKDMECEGLLECLHGLTDLDRECFEYIAETDEPVSVDEIAEYVDRERTTAYRSVQRLLNAGVITKEQETYESGGYQHVYTLAELDDVSQDMQRMVNDWYAMVGQLITEFDDKYSAPATDSDET